MPSLWGTFPVRAIHRNPRERPYPGIGKGFPLPVDIVLSIDGTTNSYRWNRSTVFTPFGLGLFLSCGGHHLFSAIYRSHTKRLLTVALICKALNGGTAGGAYGSLSLLMMALLYPSYG